MVLITHLLLVPGRKSVEATPLPLLFACLGMSWGDIHFESNYDSNFVKRAKLVNIIDL
jgi:hypothetical protein